jgi:hypothetical protein
VITGELFSDNMLQPANLQTGDNCSFLRTGVSSPPITLYAATRLWICGCSFCIEITVFYIAFLNTRNIVLANLTYLDALNKYIALYPYKALTGLSEKRSLFLLLPDEISLLPLYCHFTSFKTVLIDFLTIIKYRKNDINKIVRLVENSSKR